jgi:hypothetical protein
VGLFRKKKKENTEDVSGISSQDITIKIFRDLGSNVNTCVGEFNALEKRDSFGGMVIENAKINFLEDVDFEKEEIFDELNILLRIRNKNKKESLDILSKKIVEQKKKIKYLEKFVELNAVFNYPDEQLLLRHLTVLYNHIQNIPNEYHPIWHNVANYTTYPDYTRKHKIANLETEIFKTEFGEFLRKYAAHGSLAMMAIILCILILGVGWAGLQVMDKSKALDVAAQKSSLECVNQYNEINKQIGQLIENEVLGPLIKFTANETFEDKKNEINLKTITDLVK